MINPDWIIVAFVVALVAWHLLHLATKLKNLDGLGDREHLALDLIDPPRGGGVKIFIPYK